jgi:FtsP/CotA-like multicopper oxidase with cupredoxin domain
MRRRNNIKKEFKSKNDCFFSRRQFLKACGIAGLGVCLPLKWGSGNKAFAAIPGGTLNPADVEKYITPLLIPPAMPKAASIRLGRKQIDHYVIAMQQFQQQILPAGMPATTVWGYGPKIAKKGPKIFNAPSLTIEARHKTEVRVTWINGLVDDNGKYLPHLLPVDQTLHWANPPGGIAGRDTRPTFTSTPGPYIGPVPIVTHVHGAVGVGDESDGYAEAWYLPLAKNIPTGYARHGTWYEYFRKKAFKKHLAVWPPGSSTFVYPNNNRASTIWYHDHALGMTRLNVYAGPAGFYIVRGGPSGDKAVLDSHTNMPAVLPGPAPKEGDPFPSNITYYEIPIAIQDRAFNDNGSLFYPDTRAFFDGFGGPYIPDTDVSPIWNPEFFGNMIIANGNTWPFQTVEQRRYRFRFLNGCNSRFLILDFNNIPGVEVWQIGNEGGFLAAPVNITADHGNRLLMALAERADVIVDFTNVPQGYHVFGNVGPDEPFGGGVPGVDFDPADPLSTGQIMAFNVVPAAAPDPTTPPQFLQLPAIEPLPAEITTRSLALLEMMSMVHDGPAAAMLGNVDNMGMPMHKMWAEPISENPAVGDTEVWEFYNFTADAHPMHIHEIVFEVVNREALVLDPGTGEPVQPVQLTGNVRPPEAWESGFKDTVISYPGEVTRLRAKFDMPGTFVWHCHIVEHEDNEMMRPYRIGPADPNAPGGGM